MKPQLHWFFVCSIILLNTLQCDGIGFTFGFSAAAAAGAALYAGLNKLGCHFYECCDPRADWIKFNATALALDFQHHLYGQHLVKDVVMKALKGHLSQNNPSKALVMSFHGWTGGGKNYVARFIAENIYKLGMRSNYVHLFVSTIHFPHEQQSDIYKLHLQDWIRGNVSQCERSLFVFDEIDKMPLGMIDAIKPFIDYHESIDGVDFRKSIFLFLSNTGGPEITRTMLKMWRNGVKREEITLKDMESLIEKGAFNEDGGLHQSELIQHSLVDHCVPFLPLERRHIEMCTEDDLKRRGHTPTKAIKQRVADEMMYFPPENNLFSTTGCKRVSQKVGYILANDVYDSLFD